MSNLLLWLANLIGLIGFSYPFLGLAADPAAASVLFFGLVSVALALVVVDVASRDLDARVIALMGVLAAVNAALRLVETTLLVMPGGFSPVFLLIILVGYAFGGRLGFLYGALSLLASALVTGGLGPWLPFQMMAAAWIGLGAGGLPHPAHPRLRDALLAGYGALWGLLFGALMNLYFWPYFSGAEGWTAGLAPGEALRRYAAFYLVTSLGWDALRAVGNVVLLMALASPLLRILERFRLRMGHVRV